MIIDYNLRHTDNWYYSWIFASIVFFTPLRTVLIYFGDILCGNGRVLSILSILVFFVVLVLPLINGANSFKLDVDIILFFCFLLISWLWTFVTHIDYSNIWVNEAIDIFIKAFPFVFVARKISDYSELKNILYKSAIFTVIIMTVLSVVGTLRNDLFAEGIPYSQFHAIIISSATVLAFIAFMDTKKTLYLMILIIAIANIFIYGARMPIACVCIAIFLYCLDSIMRINQKGKYIKRNVLFFRVLIGMCFIIVIAIVLYLKTKTMEHILPGQRILWKIINGEFLSSSGRVEIYRVALESIFNKPILGTGIITDRIVISQALGTEGFQGSYAHNIFLELWMQYGLLLGSSIIGIILLCSVILFFDKRNRDKQLVGFFVISETFGILLLSGPVFSSQAFWALIGINAILIPRNLKRCIRVL